MFIAANKNLDNYTMEELVNLADYCDMGYIGRSMIKNPNLPHYIMIKVANYEAEEKMLFDTGTMPFEVLCSNPSLPDDVIKILLKKCPELVLENLDNYLNISTYLYESIKNLIFIVNERKNVFNEEKMLKNINTFLTKLNQSEYDSFVLKIKKSYKNK